MIKIALIGAGRIGTIRADIISRSSKSQLIFVNDVNSAAAKKLGVSTTIENIFKSKEIDAVVVATPTKFHMPIVTAALQANKHVLCEKPLGRNVFEAETICRSIQPGLILHLGFNYRHLPHVLKAKEIIEKNIIGEPIFFRARFGNGGRPAYEKEWCTQKDLGGGGVTIEQAIHVFDLVSFLFGEPKRILAKTDLCYHKFTDTEDNVFCLLETAQGIAQIHTSWTQWINLFEIEIFGKQGYIRLSGRDGSYGPPKLHYGIKNIDHSRPNEQEIIFADNQDSWTLDWAEFEYEIENGQNKNSSIGLQAQRIVAAAYESTKSDQWTII